MEVVASMKAHREEALWQRTQCKQSCCSLRGSKISSAS